MDSYPHRSGTRSRWLRVLERDPYDEAAHLALVASLSAASRHGDARRAYRRYSERMREIGVEPAGLNPGGPSGALARGA